MTYEFTWNPSTMVFPSVYAVAVYKNEFGDVVIRQLAAEGQAEDACIYIPPERVKDLLAAIKKAAKED